jgi:hypothetical protein
MATYLDGASTLRHLTCPQLPPSWTPSAVPRQVLAACCFLKEEKRFDPQTQKSLRLGTGSMFDDVVPHLDGSFNI